MRRNHPWRRRALTVGAVLAVILTSAAAWTFHRWQARSAPGLRERDRRPLSLVVHGARFAPDLDARGGRLRVSRCRGGAVVLSLDLTVAGSRAAHDRRGRPRRLLDVRDPVQLVPPAELGLVRTRRQPRRAGRFDAPKVRFRGVPDGRNDSTPLRTALRVVESRCASGRPHRHALPGTVRDHWHNMSSDGVVRFVGRERCGSPVRACLRSTTSPTGRSRAINRATSTWRCGCRPTTGSRFATDAT